MESFLATVINMKLLGLAGTASAVGVGHCSGPTLAGQGTLIFNLITVWADHLELQILKNN